LYPPHLFWLRPRRWGGELIVSDFGRSAKTRRLVISAGLLCDDYGLG
jgi:hypothetical protein